MDLTFDRLETFDTVDKALVRTILEHSADFPWTMQDIGLLGLRLDDRRQYRLHVWGASAIVGEPPVHDHPFDFTSVVVAGVLTNTLYEVDPGGVEYHRFRCAPSDEEARRADTVRLSGTATVLTEGDRYRQFAHQLHDSRQLPGTVTVIRMSPVEVPELTVCRREPDWVSGRSRPATPDEVQGFTARALDWF